MYEPGSTQGRNSGRRNRERKALRVTGKCLVPSELLKNGGLLTWLSILRIHCPSRRMGSQWVSLQWHSSPAQESVDCLLLEFLLSSTITGFDLLGFKRATILKRTWTLGWAKYVHAPPQKYQNTAQHNTTQHNTTQHNTNTTQHSTIQYITTQYNTTQLSTTQHNTTQHSTAQHSTTHHIKPQNNTTQHNTTHHHISPHNHKTTQHNTILTFQTFCIGIDCRTCKCASNTKARVLWKHKEAIKQCTQPALARVKTH